MAVNFAKLPELLGRKRRDKHWTVPYNGRYRGLGESGADIAFRSKLTRRTMGMTDELSDLEIAVLCDLLNDSRANLKAHKRAVLDQLLAKRLVEPAKDEPARFELSDKASRILAERGVGISGG